MAENLEQKGNIGPKGVDGQAEAFVDKKQTMGFSNSHNGQTSAGGYVDTQSSGGQIASELIETPKSKDPMRMAIAEWNRQKQENKRVREMNDENLKDMRMQAEYEKLSYEIANYRLLAIKDFIERTELADQYDAAKVKFNEMKEKIQSQEAPE